MTASGFWGLGFLFLFFNVVSLPVQYYLDLVLILGAYGNVKLQRQKGVQGQIPKAGKVGTQAVPEVSRQERKHPRAEDKLDQLVAEYRTKYFNPPVASIDNSTGKGSTKVAAGDLHRWFE